MCRHGTRSVPTTTRAKRMVTRRFALIINSKSGTHRSLRVLDQLQRLFSAAQIQVEVFSTEFSGHAVELARALDVTQYAALCVLGGDGTIHEVVNGLLERDEPATIPIGIVPTGTGNSISRHFQFASVEHALERILNGQTKRIDVARVAAADETCYCLNIVGWGAAVDINRTAERFRKLGPPRYALAALGEIARARRRHAKLVLDDVVIDDEFLMVVGCNTQYTGKGMRLAPRADISDGKLDVVVVRRATRLQMLRLFRQVYSGAHLNLGFVEYHQVSKFRLETDEHDPLNLDGELRGRSPVDVQMVPGALQVFV